MSQRQTKLQRCMAHAQVAATGSHDAETQVGAVLVKSDSGSVIATGCNGFVRGAPDDKLPRHRPEKYKFIVHAEKNLLANCLYEGIGTRGCFMVTTMTPCRDCMRMMFQAGIKRVVSLQKYSDYNDIVTMPDIKVIESTSPEGYIELTYANY